MDKSLFQAKYFKIYIDEYQDCDKSMHKFFMYLCDELKIQHHFQFLLILIQQLDFLNDYYV